MKSFCFNIVNITLFFLLSFFKVYSFSNDEIEKFSKHVENTIKYHNLPAIVVGVVSGEKTIYKKIHGRKCSKLQNTDPDNKVNKNTIFRVASITKFFTGLLLEVLSHNKQISFDDCILNHLPELKKVVHTKLYSLKVQHITNHTVGLLPYFMIDYENHHKSASLELVVNVINREKKIFSPGRIFAYQNVFFNIISHYIEKKIKMSYIEALKFYIMDPLNIKDYTVLNDDFIKHTNKAIPSSCAKNFPTKLYVNNSNLGNYDNIMAAGGLAISFKSSINILKALLKGEAPFHRSIFENFHKKKVLACGPSKQCTKRACLFKHQVDSFYGNGCRIVNVNGIDVFYHFGFLNGVTSVIAIIPTKDIALFAYTNTSTSAITEIFIKFCTTVCGPCNKFSTLRYERNLIKGVGIVKNKFHKRTLRNVIDKSKKLSKKRNLRVTRKKIAKDTNKTKKRSVKLDATKKKRS